MNHTQETVADAAVRISPPAAVMGASLLDMSVADWIQWLTLFYLVLLLGNKIWHMSVEFKQYWFERKAKKKKAAAAKACELPEIGQ